MEKDNRYVIDMNRFHSYNPDTGKTHICLAGTRYYRARWRYDRTYNPTLNWRFRDDVLSLNELRIGNVEGALFWQGVEVDRYSMLHRATGFSIDRAAFYRDLEELACHLKSGNQNL